MPQNLRLRDAIPTVLAFAASLAFAALLIAANSSSATVTSAALLIDTEAALVEGRAVGVPRPGRLAVSPSLSEVVEVEAADVVVVDVASGELDSPVARDSALGDAAERTPVDDSSTIEGSVPSVDAADAVPDDDRSAVIAAGGNDISASDDAAVVTSAPARPTPTTVLLTTAPFAQPLSATTTEAPVDVVASERVPVQRITTTRVARPTSTTRPAPVTSTRPETTTTTTTSTTTSSTTSTTTSSTTTTRAPAPVYVSGRYSVAEVIDGTIGVGDGSNPNEESPMGRHDASLYLPQGWNWAQGTTRNTQWGNLGSNQFAEFRCAVIPENGHVPPVDFRINFTEGAYYQFAGGSWSKAFDVALDSPSHGAYLGIAGQVNADPFASGQGAINWRRETDGSYSAPWNPAALMMHFWAGERESPLPGQSAEFLTSQMRLQQPDGKTVDLSRVRVLFQCGIDYYNTTGGQGTRVPGPGIAKYHWLTPAWQPGLWVTLPGNVPAADAGDFRTWLEANLPPDVRR